MNRLTILGAAAALVTVPVLGVSIAVAQDGADDPVGHVRHSGVDDGPTHDATPGSRPSVFSGDDATDGATHDATDDRGRRHGGHGADDPAGHVRHSGTDDGPTHEATHEATHEVTDGATHDADDDHGDHSGHGGDDHGGDDHAGDDHGGDDRGGDDD